MQDYKLRVLFEVCFELSRSCVIAKAQTAEEHTIIRRVFSSIWRFGICEKDFVGLLVTESERHSEFGMHEQTDLVES